MISTFYLFQFFAFYIWQLTSKQVKRKQITEYLMVVSQNRTGSRWFGGILFMVACTLFVAKLGLMSGICAFIIGLMGVGCLSVALEPFAYMRLKTIAILYIAAFALEIFI